MRKPVPGPRLPIFHHHHLYSLASLQMHPFLNLPPELVFQILQDVPSDDLLNVALSCRILSIFVLKLWWEDQEVSFRTLLRILEDICGLEITYHMGYAYTIRNDPSAQTLASKASESAKRCFWEHASRITKLSMDNGITDTLLGVLSTIIQPIGELPLCPQVQSLRLGNDALCSPVPVLSSISGSLVNHLTLAGDASPIQQTVDELPKNLESIQRLSIEPMEETHIQLDIFHDLRTFSWAGNCLPDSTWDALAGCSHLDSIEIVDFCNGDKETHTGLGKSLVFHNLRRFSSLHESEHHHPAYQRLTRTSLPNLRTLQLGTPIYDADSIRSMFETLKSCSPLLEDLEMTIWSSVFPIDVVFPFQTLRRLILVDVSQLKLTDHQVQLLGTSLPDLETLSISTRSLLRPANASRQLSLQSLCYLAQSCKSLSSLYISVSATSTPAEVYSSSELPCFTRLKRLALWPLYTMSNESTKVATFLSRSCPDVTELDVFPILLDVAEPAIRRPIVDFLWDSQEPVLGAKVVRDQIRERFLGLQTDI
ncbi:hypothetical protein FRB99_006479 [Tulasnella sp. 403]|nr:hypothetical protein FRB99_006479 [Tulasnella sp. 403]